MFQKNIGILDRLARVAIGAVLLLGAITETMGPWAFIGLIPLLTAAVGNCPLYSLIGLKTCKAC